MATTNGGKRPGAGRPKGSTNANTFRLSDYVSDADRATFIEFMLSTYMSDMRVATWLGDHLFSKPRQDVDVTTGGEKLPAPILSNVIHSDQSRT